MEEHGKQKQKKNGARFFRDTIEIHYEKDGVLKPVELRGRLISVAGNPDGSNHWAFFVKPKPTNAKTPSSLGVGGKESARDIVHRKMSGQRGRIQWISPRGVATEKFGLVAWGALLGAAIYKNLSHFLGF